MCVFWLTEDLEAREYKGKTVGQYTASNGESHARRAARLAETGGAGRRVSNETVQTENPRRYHS